MNRKSRLHKLFCTIRFRILFITVSTLVFICLIVTVISYLVVSDNLRQNAVQTAETRLSYLGSNITSNMDGVVNFIESCVKSKEIKDFVMEEKTADNTGKRKAHDYAMLSYTSNPALPSSLIRVVIVSKCRSDIVQIVESPYSSTAVTSEAILSLPYFEELYENSGSLTTGLMPDPFLYSKKVFMIPSVYPIPDPYRAGEVGYIFTEASVRNITQPMQRYRSENNSILYLRIGNCCYRYDSASNCLTLYGEPFEVQDDLSGKALRSDTLVSRIRQDGHRAILVSRPVGIPGWYVMESLDESVLRNNVFSTFFLILLVILLVAAVIGVLLSIFLSRTVNEPVQKLQKRMLRISEGDFSRDPETEWEHELGDIGKNINDLSENVLTLMNQRLEDERQKRDYEYKMLQSQINPHFLYNTLNSIKWMATIQGASGIAEMTTALSRLLKDIAKGTTNVISLQHEISLLKDYFTIQQYRYGGAVSLCWQIDDEKLTACKILKFTLQPIVENAIFHGIEPKGSAGTITVHIWQDDASDVHIDITDDGVGMDEQMAAQLLDTSDSPAKSSFFREIGIRNVHKRLQYEFGAGYGLFVKSVPGLYTTVTVLLPFCSVTNDN